jgi:SET domain-containing protein
MQSTICDRLYIIQEIPGKGHGLVAATTITKGTRILSESPLFRVPQGGNSKEQLRDSISKKIAALREEQRQAFLSLRNSFEDEDGPELGRVRTNALPLGSDATTGGIFLDSSCINHSCNPNA